MGARSRRKGAGWEVEVAHRIENATGQKAQRVLTECRDGNSGDVDCPTLPIVWQCKVGGRPDIYAAVREAREVADPRAFIPIAVVKRNGAGKRPPDELAVLPLDHLLEMVYTLKKLGAW